jgi:hypothetical protein
LFLIIYMFCNISVKLHENQLKYYAIHFPTHSQICPHSLASQLYFLVRRARLINNQLDFQALRD